MECFLDDDNQNQNNFSNLQKMITESSDAKYDNIPTPVSIVTKVGVGGPSQRASFQSMQNMKTTSSRKNMTPMVEALCKTGKPPPNPSTLHHNNTIFVLKEAQIVTY